MTRLTAPSDESSPLTSTRSRTPALDPGAVHWGWSCWQLGHPVSVIIGMLLGWEAWAWPPHWPDKGNEGCIGTCFAIVKHHLGYESMESLNAQYQADW